MQIRWLQYERLRTKTLLKKQQIQILIKAYFFLGIYTALLLIQPKFSNCTSTDLDLWELSS